jgi:hypothetical protein
MYVDTLHLKDDRSLVSVANEIFPLFQITKFEKRESSFYPTGQYYLGRGATFELRISVEDDIGFEEYNYWLVFSHHDKSDDGPREVVRTLMAKNYRICRGLGDERNRTREVYSMGPDNQIVATNEPARK